MTKQVESKAVGLLIGRIVQAAVCIFLLADAAVQFFAPNMTAEGMKMVGLSMELVPFLGMIMLVCTILYAIPRTSILGSILTTGFLGGAICVNLRDDVMISTPIIICLIVGILTWLGLYLQDPRVRDIFPVRRD